MMRCSPGNAIKSNSGAVSYRSIRIHAFINSRSDLLTRLLIRPGASPASTERPSKTRASGAALREKFAENHLAVVPGTRD
jgi:hypothetical protein